MLFFFSFIQGFCGQSHTDSLLDSCGTLLEARSGTLFLAMPTMLLGKPFLMKMGSTMALKRTNADHNGISVNLFLTPHAHVQTKLYEL